MVNKGVGLPASIEAELKVTGANFEERFLFPPQRIGGNKVIDALYQ
jgi:hypothetical protein